MIVGDQVRFVPKHPRAWYRGVGTVVRVLDTDTVIVRWPHHGIATHTVSQLRKADL